MAADSLAVWATRVRAGGGSRGRGARSNDFAPVPGLGGAPPLFLPVNAFVLHAEQPVVIDTGLSNAEKDFVSALAKVVDPADVRWLWITHPDRDHTKPRHKPGW